MVFLIGAPGLKSKDNIKTCLHLVSMIKELANLILSSGLALVKGCNLSRN